MNDHIERIRCSVREPINTIVHVGSGSGAAIDEWRPLTPVRLVLLEGDPDARAQLQAHTGRASHVEVFGEVVAPRHGMLDWYRHTLSTLNGPHDRSDLVSHYPRLRGLGTQPLQAKAFVEWLRPIADGLPEGRIHLLMMDVPGQEEHLLATLPTEMLQRFEVVVLRGCAISTPKLAETAGTAAQRLRSAGYRDLNHDGDDDPLWPLTVLCLDATRAQLLQLRRETVDLEHRLHAQTLQREEADRQAQALQVQLRSAEAQATAAQALAAEHQDRIAALAADCGTQARKADEMQAELVRERAECSKLAAELKALKTALQSAEETRGRQAGQLGPLQAKLAQAEAEVAQLKVLVETEQKQALKDHRQLSKELAEARQTASLAVKLQTLREADLRDLQQRYQVALAQQQSQHELLSKLGQRLSVAMQYFQELSLEQQTSTGVVGNDARSTP